MSICSRSSLFFRNRNARRERMLRKMSAMRAAKARNRLANPVEHEPRMQRYYPLELGLRDRRSGEVAWVPFRSIRDSIRRLSVVQRWYTP